MAGKQRAEGTWYDRHADEVQARNAEKARIRDEERAKAGIVVKRGRKKGSKNKPKEDRLGIPATKEEFVQGLMKIYEELCKKADLPA